MTFKSSYKFSVLHLIEQVEIKGIGSLIFLYRNNICYFTWKNLEFDNLGKKNLEFEKFLKNWNFGQKTWKNLEFNNFNMISSKILSGTKNISLK